MSSLRDFALECFCFGSEAMNAAVRGLVKSRVEFLLYRSRITPATQANNEKI